MEEEKNMQTYLNSLNNKTIGLLDNDFFEIQK